MHFYQKFMVAIKKSIQGTKIGEAGFKLGIDGAYINANANIAESFKMMEDAIVLSGANDNNRKIFKIGINCDADSGFNKEPKEPNKYEQEGQKGQFDAQVMADYYAKIINEHPLLTYIEDAFA
jgi:enolase